VLGASQRLLDGVFSPSPTVVISLPVLGTCPAAPHPVKPQSTHASHPTHVGLKPIITCTHWAPGPTTKASCLDLGAPFAPHGIRASLWAGHGHST